MPPRVNRRAGGCGIGGRGGVKGVSGAEKGRLAGVFAFYAGGPFVNAKIGQLRQGYMGTGRCRHQDAFKSCNIIAQLPVIPQVDRITLEALDGLVAHLRGERKGS